MTTETRPAFTPGPWKITRDAEYIYEIGPVYGQPLWSNAYLHVSDEDARLIAAAPELYEALQFVDRILRESDKVAYDIEAWWNGTARAALEKADGR